MTLFAPKAALGAAVSALVLGCTAIAGSAPANDTGLACSVTVTPSRGMLLIEGQVQSDTATSGMYQLRVERGGTLMNQGGMFDLFAGDTATLGRVTMNGPTRGLDATLTLTVDGNDYLCPTDL